MQDQWFGKRAWQGLGAVLIVGMLALAGCGGNGSNTNPGVDLGAGPLLAFIGGDGNLWLARADGTGAHAVTVTPCPNTVNCYGPPAWSPNGQEVAVFGPDVSNPGTNKIYVFNRMGLLTATLSPVNDLAFGTPLWSSDGKTLAYPGNPVSSDTKSSAAPQYALLELNATTGAKVGTITLPSPIGDNAQCSDAPAGGPLGSAVDRTINGSNGVRATADWSPDGNHVLISGGNCNSQVMLVDHSGNSQVLAPVTSGAINNSAESALFSPNGQQIVATQSTATEDDLLVYDGTGGNGKIIVSDTDTPPSFSVRISSPTWSADGKQIFFMHGADIWVIQADGSNAHKLIGGTASGATLKDEGDPQPSPDGKALAWDESTLSTVDNMPHSALFVGDGAGNNPKLVEQGGVWPAWS
jgi:Tol biopolymer transport system component